MSQKSPTRKRQGPLEHAKNFKVGTIKKGRDGNQWIIKKIKKKNGTIYNRWVRLSLASPTNKQFIPSNSKVRISFSVNFIHFKNDFIECCKSPYPGELPKPVFNEVIQYFNSKEFKNNFEKRIEGVDDKTTINKIDWLVDELLLVDLYCTIHSKHKIDIEEYKQGVKDTLYAMSHAGSPTVSKYGKYLGEYKGRYGMYIDNNINVDI